MDTSKQTDVKGAEPGHHVSISINSPGEQHIAGRDLIEVNIYLGRVRKRPDQEARAHGANHCARERDGSGVDIPSGEDVVLT